MLARLDIRVLAAAIISGLIAFAATLTSPVRSLEAFLSDARISAHNTSTPLSKEIVIIAVDDPSLEEFPYLSPINRNFLATVAEKLDKSEAALVGIDILFDRASVAEEDARLTEAIGSSSVPFVLVSDPGLEARMTICKGRPPAETDSSRILNAFKAVASTGHGVFCVERLDGVLRAMPRDFNDRASFTGALYTRHTGESAKSTLTAGNIPFSLTEKRSWPFPTYSAGMAEQLPDEWLRDKIVLIGAITPYSGDWYTTPLRFAGLRHVIEPAGQMPEGQIPGVVLHAYALQAMLNGQLVHTPGPGLAILCLGIGCLAGLGFGLSRWPLPLVAAAIVTTLLVYWLFIYWLHATAGLIVPFTSFALGLLVTVTAIFALVERRERAHRRLIHHSFKHFLAPQVVDRLTKAPGRLKLDAEEREVTALFTDLASFTKFVDTTPASQVSAILNGYLDVVIDEVVAHGGVVDKIVGDAVHALFSTPLEDPEHRMNGVRCAVAIAAKTEAFRKELAETGAHIGHTRIGINSGTALVGNFGSSKRFDYTAHGSTINVAARLEAANKEFGTRICASEDSCADCPGIVYREIGLINARGVSQPLRVFEVLPEGAISQADIEKYLQAISLLEDAPTEALRLLKELSTQNPSDGLVIYQIERLLVAS